jgi:nucleoside-diphosphate-sugar epimerase
VTTTLLLTGAQGFLGRQIAATWLRDHPADRVVGVGRSVFDDERFTYGHAVIGAERAGLPPSLRGLARDPRWSYRRVDLADAAAVRGLVADIRPTAVIHSAAALRGDPLSALISSNVLATAALARAVGELVPGTRFVLVSSGSVHGLVSASGAPAPDPEPYAVSKRAAELAVAAECVASGLPAVSARVFNLIGPGLQDRHLPGRVSLELAVAEKTGTRELRVGALDAERDVVDVRDAADAVAALAASSADAFALLPTEGALRVADVGTGRAVSMREVVGLQLEASGLAGRVDVVESESRPMGAASLCADPSAIAGLGAAPRIPLAQTLAEMADYARSQL